MIELKHLRTLDALEQTGTISKAAIKLHLTQSAISHQLAELEQRLGHTLFIRKSEPLTFTEQGNVLLDLAKQVLPMVEQALHTCATSVTSTLRLAIECHSCIQWLTPALKTFKEIWPHVNVDFQSGVTFDPQPALQKDKLDLVLTSDILPNSHLYYEPMFDFEVRLVVAPEHPLANKANIVPEDIAKETFFIYPVQRQRFDAYRQFLQPAGVNPEFRNVDNTLLLIQMVSAQMGVAALPHWAVENFERQGLVVTRPLGEGLWSRLYAAVTKNKQEQPMLNGFIQIAKEHAINHLPFVQAVK